jgi:hypothetical protein
MSCDPNTLLAQATQFLALSPGQLTSATIGALADVAEGGGFVSGDFRITELADIRSTEAGDLRIWH